MKIGNYYTEESIFYIYIYNMNYMRVCQFNSIGNNCTSVGRNGKPCNIIENLKSNNN